ncbi:MAG: hypothetical protein H7329_06880 [Opitutaceae bacterium]|nr:hypothetical protein [Cytophagales bacterium]
MTDLEFDILDELYFVKSFADLQKDFPTFGTKLISELEKLIIKGWIRVLDEHDNEIQLSNEKFNSIESQFKFIATKQGLKAHNQV